MSVLPCFVLEPQTEKHCILHTPYCTWLARVWWWVYYLNDSDIQDYTGDEKDHEKMYLVICIVLNAWGSQVVDPGNVYLCIVVLFYFNT